jgi:hypothetical protein
MVLIRLDINIFCYKYVRFYTGCGNLMVNVDEEQDFQKKKKKKTGNIRVTITFLHCC